MKKTINASLILLGITSLFACTKVHDKYADEKINEEIPTAAATDRFFYTINPEPQNFLLGTQQISIGLAAGISNPLADLKAKTLELGSNIFKMNLGRSADSLYKITKYSSDTTTKKFISNHPEFTSILNESKFKYIFFWAHGRTVSEWKDGVTLLDSARFYNEMYDFTKWLLVNYGSGKEFFIGNWEGDWLLTGQQNASIDATSAQVTNYKTWMRIRSKAVEAARNAWGAGKSSKVYFYIEVNQVDKGRVQNKLCVTKDILPHVKTDFVSYSSYECLLGSTPSASYSTLKSSIALRTDYIKTKQALNKFANYGMSTSTNRVFIGEYGYQRTTWTQADIDLQTRRQRMVMKASIDLGFPFALHWQLYNNEYTSEGISQNMGLYNEEGTKWNIFYTMNAYLKGMNDFFVEKKNAGITPTTADVKARALTYFSDL
jgi:hypothetical protein